MTPAHGSVPRARLSSRRKAGPCTMVILGARGDLSRRKLLPALYLLAADGLLDEGFAAIGVAREDLDDASFRAEVRKGLAESGSEAGPFDEAVWKRLETCLFYSRGDLNDPGAYTAPFTGGFDLGWDAGIELFEYICQQSNYAGELMVGGERSNVDRSSPIVP